MKTNQGSIYICKSLKLELFGFTCGRLYKCNCDDTLYNDNSSNVVVSAMADDSFDLWTKEFKLDNETILATDFLDDVSKQDMVHHPAHYSDGRSIEPFDVIIDWNLDFFLGNAIKYIARIGRKHDSVMSDTEKSIEDIDKAIVYLQKYKELLQKQN